ncbi:MAG: hypothetical protein ACTHXA_09535 [Gulosibacter sp.]|uniref:hypothetical protein n=1 Tax=Gulosibacter sp. TaxID=2817531 RepID=UPI003F8E5294
MRRFWRGAIATALGALLIASGGTIAAAAEAGPPDLPFDPHEYGDRQWVGMPSHTQCAADGTGSNELVISFAETWTGPTEIEIKATSSISDSAADSEVIWEETAKIEPGEWDSFTVPIEDGGVRIWIDEAGLNYNGNIGSECQSAPVQPDRDGNTIEIPDNDDLQYYVAPRSVNGEAVQGKWGTTTFSGFYAGEQLLEEFATPVTGEIAIPEEGLRVFATGKYGVKMQFSWTDATVSDWEFDYETSPETPQTPGTPTQDGNTVTIPESQSFTYEDASGAVLSAGKVSMTGDLVVIAVPNEDIEIAKGAVTQWSFTFNAKPTATPPPTTPPTGAGPSSTDLTAATRGYTQAPTEAAAGDPITVTVGDMFAGEEVNIIVFSTPRDLGTFMVSEKGTVLVTMPDDLEPGSHRIAIYELSGEVIGWDPIVVTPRAGPPSETHTASESLVDSGVAVPIGTVAMAALLLAAGIGAFLVEHRRDRETEA